MVIVGGIFQVDPDQREQFLAGRHDLMRTSRGESGCLEYVFSADPIDPSRVVLFERWTSQEALDAHIADLRSGQRSADTGPAPITSSIVIYDVVGERGFGD